MKGFKPEYFLFYIVLYIPHGSDERPSCSLMENSSSLFISHMVQMKGSFIPLSESQCGNFISHMVQMKGNHPFFVFYEQIKLYIPHGSDESAMQQFL